MTVTQVKNIIQVKNWTFGTIQEEGLFEVLREQDGIIKSALFWERMHRKAKSLKDENNKQKFINLAARFLGREILHENWSEDKTKCMIGKHLVMEANVETSDTEFEGEIILQEGQIFYKGKMVETNPYFDFEKGANIYPVEFFELGRVEEEFGILLRPFAEEVMYPLAVKHQEKEQEKEIAELKERQEREVERLRRIEPKKKKKHNFLSFLGINRK